MNITITIPLSMRPVATRDTAWHVESPGTTTAPDDAEIVLAHRGQEGRVRLREIGSRLMSAWAYPISEEAYQRHLAEIAAEHEQVDAAPDDARGMAVSHVQRGWLLARLRERDALVTDLQTSMAGLVDALGAIGEALPPLPLGSARRTYKQMTEEVARLTAALRDAKVLDGNGTLGEMAETICHLADILRNVPTKVEHRCADPKACPLCRLQERHGYVSSGGCSECENEPGMLHGVDCSRSRESHKQDGSAFFEASFGAGRETMSTPEGRRFLREMRGGLDPTDGDDAPEETNPGAHDPAAMWGDMAADLAHAERDPIDGAVRDPHGVRVAQPPPDAAVDEPAEGDES
jgi:hypothetical protein